MRQGLVLAHGIQVVVNLKAKTLDQRNQQIFVLTRENQFALGPITLTDGVNHWGQFDRFGSRANDHHQFLFF
jgi:hypothetical protein